MGPQVWEEVQRGSRDGQAHARVAANLVFIEVHHLTHPNQKIRLNALAVVTFKEFKAAYVAPRRGHLILHHWHAYSGGIEEPPPPMNRSAAGSSSAANGFASDKSGQLGASGS